MVEAYAPAAPPQSNTASTTITQRRRMTWKYPTSPIDHSPFDLRLARRCPDLSGQHQAEQARASEVLAPPSRSPTAKLRPAGSSLLPPYCPEFLVRRVQGTRSAQAQKQSAGYAAHAASAQRIKAARR